MTTRTTTTYSSSKNSSLSSSKTTTTYSSSKNSSPSSSSSSRTTTSYSGSNNSSSRTTTYSNSKSSNDNSAATDATALDAKKKSYEELKKGIKESGADLGNASTDLLNVAEILPNAFTGSVANLIKNAIGKIQEEFNEITNKLDSIYNKATEKEQQLGGTSNTSSSGLLSNLSSIKGKNNTGTYNCDTDVLRNLVLPLLNTADKNLEKASTTASGLPREEGCEDIGEISPKINDAKKDVKGVYEQVEAAIEAAENAENVNMGLVNAFGASVTKFTRTTTTTKTTTTTTKTTPPTRTTTPSTRPTTPSTRTNTPSTRTTTPKDYQTIKRI